jgi:hypothetical protein
MNESDTNERADEEEDDIKLTFDSDDEDDDWLLDDPVPASQIDNDDLQAGEEVESLAENEDTLVASEDEISDAQPLPQPQGPVTSTPVDPNGAPQIIVGEGGNVIIQTAATAVDNTEKKRRKKERKRRKQAEADLASANTAAAETLEQQKVASAKTLAEQNAEFQKIIDQFQVDKEDILQKRDDILREAQNRVSDAERERDAARTREAASRKKPPVTSTPPAVIPPATPAKPKSASINPLPQAPKIASMRDHIGSGSMRVAGLNTLKGPVQAPTPPAAPTPQNTPAAPAANGANPAKPAAKKAKTDEKAKKPAEKKKK